MSTSSPEYAELPREKFRSTANKLLNVGFLLRKDKDTVNDYHFIIQNRQAFADFFDLIGYEIIIQESTGVISVTNVFGTGRIQLKKNESILLLILRLLYLEKRKEILEVDDVIVVADEIYDKYAMLKLSQRLDRATLRNALAHFKRHNLILNLDSDMGDHETRIKIQPSILLAVTSESLEAVYQQAKEKIAKYAGTSTEFTREEDDDEETD